MPSDLSRSAIVLAILRIRCNPRTATDKRDHRGGVVWVTKQARLDQPAGGKLACILGTLSF